MFENVQKGFPVVYAFFMTNCFLSGVLFFKWVRHSRVCSLHSRLAEECLTDEESYLVPIAVGVALLVLILIVLLAYFIGRKRSMASGYQSF